MVRKQELLSSIRNPSYLSRDTWNTDIPQPSWSQGLQRPQVVPQIRCGFDRNSLIYLLDILCAELSDTNPNCVFFSFRVNRDDALCWYRVV